MSFRGDEQRRYGHVPPVQYPVANSAPDVTSTQPARRPSFNDGDDAGHYDPAAARGQPFQSAPVHGEEELFLTSPTDTTPTSSSRPSFGSPNPALSGYQHQYQGQAPAPPTPTHTTYNPQHFVRSHSASLPYHPSPASRYTSPTTPTYPNNAINYTPQAYNPAAYASTMQPPPPPQRQGTIQGYGGYTHSYSSPVVPQVPAGHGLPTYNPSLPALNIGGIAQPRYDSQGGASPYASSTPGATPGSYDQAYASQQSGQYFGSTNGAGTQPASVSQTPYPIHSHIPVGPNYATSDAHSFHNRASRSNSQASSLASPSIQSQGSPGLQRHPTNAPLPSRPMEDVPEDATWNPADRADDDDFAQEHLTQDNIIQDIVSDLGVAANPHRPRPINGNVSDDDMERLRRYDSRASTTVNSVAAGGGIGRVASDASTVNRNAQSSAYEWEDDDDESDPEGAAGVLAMQQADEDDRRFSGIATFGYADQPQSLPTSSHSRLPPAAEERDTSDSDLAMDLDMYGGGYAGNLAYGAEAGPASGSAPPPDTGKPLPIPQDTPTNGRHPAAFTTEASMDYGGTGGLLPPSNPRLSFDEGDERVSVHSRQSGSESPLKDDYPDMFYHPGLSNRPLPALPPGSDSSSMLSVQTANRGPYQHGYSLSADSRTLYHPEGTDAHSAQLAAQQAVERSTSLSSHNSAPQVQPLPRSRTDAAEERRKALRQLTQQQQLAAQQGLPYDGYDTGTPNSMPYDTITLPSGRRRKYVPSKLTPADIKRCAEPWALSGMADWLREMAEGEPDLKRKSLEEGLIKLFCTKVPTMNVADAEQLSAMVVDRMFDEGILIPEEEWVKFAQGSLSGVLWQLTGSGCYAPKLHDNEKTSATRLEDNDSPTRCYSYHCTRTLRKANLDDLMTEATQHKAWAEYYGINGDEAVEARGAAEVARQNAIHEIIYGEEDYMGQLDVVRLLYRDQLKAWQPPIIPPQRLDKFIQKVFGMVDVVQQTNKDHLLAQLKYREAEQGPWISGVSDIFREWIRKAHAPYVEFSSQFSYVERDIRREAKRNILFRQFLELVRNHKRSQRLDWITFFKAPITRLQRYSLLLSVVHKKTKDGEEKTNLEKAIQEIRDVTLECDAKVDEAKKNITLLQLQSQLVLRPGFQSVLGLDQPGHRILQKGELLRMGSKGVRWVDTFAFLFNHYFVLSKAVGGVREDDPDQKYDVSKEPIPMPLLFLESMNDDPISKQKGLAAPLTRTAAAGSDTKLSKIHSNGERPGLEHTTTSSSASSLPVSRLGTAGSNDMEGKILYPFKIKHLGHEVYTLYANREIDRMNWCKNIIEAKAGHAHQLYLQDAEPFRLRVLADGAFAYDSISGLGKSGGVSIRGAPLDRAIREMEQTYGPGRGPTPPICRAQVNCATAFTAYQKSLIAIGTDYGVFVSESSNPRGWSKVPAISSGRITQIAVLEEFSVCLVISDRSLIAHSLESISPPSAFPAPVTDNARKAPQRLAKDVAFFATARMKDRTLLFYKRKEGLHNTFKVLEPVFQKASEKKTRIFSSRKGGSGVTESFRDFDEFYLPTECYSLNLFQSYIAIASAKGFELLTLDRKQPMSIPRDITLPAIANIAGRIRDQRPLGMFKLNEQEFILAYEDCAVYVDKHGEVSRTLIMEYSGKQKKAKSATMFGQFLILFNEDYVEVRNAENGRLRQIIAGRDVRVLDHGFRGPTGNTGGFGGAAAGAQFVGGRPPPGVGQDAKGTVKICMAHPEVAGGQIVLEMLLNDKHMEKA